ncbi:Kanamycin B dioxygenase [Galdieria sulphuraria]|nr:Kanamycin B dioxygenase [Galdieria sulphuraria]
MIRLLKSYTQLRYCTRALQENLKMSAVSYIEPTKEELKQQKLSEANLKKAVNAMEEDGIVVLNNVVDLQHLNLLNQKMLEDLKYLQSRKDAPENYNNSNYQQDPPPFHPYLFKDIVFNEFAIQVTEAVLGKGVKLNFYSGNTAVPSTLRQPVHSDSNFQHPNEPFGLVVNIPLITMTPENGSTEVWPGTHTFTNSHLQEGRLGVIRRDELERRRKISPPLQPVIPRGSLVVRDLRLWHAGMPNKTQNPRVMLAMIHWASWYKNKMFIEATKGTEEFFQHAKLKAMVEFREKVLYLDHPFGNAYNFQEEDFPEQLFCRVK